VTGFTGQPSKDAQGNWQFNTLPLGLQVINTADGSQIARIETEATEIDLSDDGTTLFLRGWADNNSWTDVLDATTLETVEHVKGQLLYPTRTLSGEIWAVGSPQGQGTGSMYVFDRKGYTQVSVLKGNGYWVSTP
jgi:hypothetical protein